MKRIILCLGFMLLSRFILAQNNSLGFEIPRISVGAEFNLFLQEKIRNGEETDIKFTSSSITFQKFESSTLITTYEGINFDQNASLTGYYQIPPDPIGAVGPNHMVSVVNSTIEWFTKAGVKQGSKRLGRDAGGSIVGSFFETLGPVSGTFDPKVIYDQYNGRFVVITLEQQSTPQVSRILVAVSQTSDPNGGWYFHLIN